MRIGILAQQLGTTVHAIRFYERRGLLPAPGLSVGQPRQRPPVAPKLAYHDCQSETARTPASRPPSMTASRKRKELAAPRRLAGKRRASGRRQAVLEREAGGGGAAPRFAVEVGTFTGYSSLCIARGPPDGGRLLCCDVSEEFTDVARRFSQRARVCRTRSSCG